MFSNDSAAITAAIRAGSIQQVQAEPRHQRSGASPAAAGRGAATAQANGQLARR